MLAMFAITSHGSPHSSPQCGVLIPQHGFADNLPGKPLTYATSVAECCHFCHITPGCKHWTWNGPRPGNGYCYAKASNRSGGGSPTMVSGGIAPGPPLPPPPPTAITLVLATPVSVMEPTFASWNIDSSCNRGFHRIHFDNPNLLEAARGLAPSRLRFGGSGNDNLVYGFTPGSPECATVSPTDCGYTTPGCLNASHWDSLYNFANRSGADFIFGVAYGLDRACAAGAGYVWNASNAAALLRYVKVHLLDQTLVGCISWSARAEPGPTLAGDESDPSLAEADCSRLAMKRGGAQLCPAIPAPPLFRLGAEPDSLAHPPSGRRMGSTFTASSWVTVRSPPSPRRSSLAVCE